MLRPLVKKIVCFILSLAAIFFIQTKTAAATSGVVLNEIAWMGTKAASTDEWIELYNNSSESISLDGWTLREGNGTIIISLKDTIAPKSFYLIERTDDFTITDIPANLTGSWGGSGLSNAGEKIMLKDNLLNTIDEIDCSAPNGWFAGKAGPDYQTMEKINPQGNSADRENWATNNGLLVTGHDVNGNPIQGTPGIANSVASPNNTPTPSASPTPSPSVSAAPSPSSPAATPIPQISPIAPSAPTPSPAAPAYQFSNDIFLNEFMPNPGKAEKEWVELYNNGAEAINLTGWQIDDAQNSRQPKVIPENTTLKPKEFLVVYFDNGLFNNDSDEVRLLWPDDQILHSVAYKNAPADSSSARFDNQWFWTNRPTPGAGNKKSANNQAERINSGANLASVKTAVVQNQLIASTRQETISEPNKNVIAQQPYSQQPQNNAAPTDTDNQLAGTSANLPAQTSQNNLAAAVPGPQSSNLKTYLLIILLFLGSGAAGLGLIYLKRKTSRQNETKNKNI